MKGMHSRVSLLLFLVGLLHPCATFAQGSEPPADGVNSGNYNVKQSFEFGGRISDFTGNLRVYETFVNLSGGPRLLEHNLEMRSLDHQGFLFDDFFLSSFGYGGDPNAVTRLRAYKNRWYNFSGTFRLDRNRWDYNLLANPLNPPTSNPAFPVTVSPHKMELVRRMSDFNLTLLPQSRVRFRLGYTRNISEGPSFSSFNEGTQALVFQGWKTTLNGYQFGVDFKLLPRTSISYDQFFSYYKGDTSWTDTVGSTQLGVPRLFAQLSNGNPVDLGLIFNTTATQPCATPISDPTTTPPTANPACNAFLAYNRFGRIRTSYPTEQISLQSNYFPNLDFAGRFTYSSSNSDTPDYVELYQGLVTRTRQREISSSGPASSKRVSVSTDLAATWHATKKFRVMDTFRFAYFRIPGLFELSEASLFGTSMLVAPNVFVPGPAPPANCPTGTEPTCPQHSSSSPADVVAAESSRFLGQDSKQNLFELLYDFNRRFGGSLAYRFGRRTITHRFEDTEDLLFFPTLPNRGACAGEPLLPDGSCQVVEVDEENEKTVINEHSLLMGLWTRPSDAWRITFDVELFSADRSFTRISPRQRQQYKLRARYKPVEWATLALALNILENRNNVVEIFHRRHNRSYSFSAFLVPTKTFALDFGYTYLDIFSETNICYSLGSAPPPPGSSPCPSATPAPIQAISVYDNKINFGYGNVMWKPFARLTTNVGYAITSTSGETLILSPNAPAGTLNFNFHKPYASLALDFAKGLTGKAAWGYYGYNEKTPADPFSLARDFRGNLVTLSIRYAF